MGPELKNTLERHPEWEMRLYQKTARDAATAHSWGTHDCVTFAADCVTAITDTDIIEDVRGRYRSKTGAIRIMRSLGFSDLGDLAASRLQEIPVSVVRRGDVVLCDGTEHEGDFLAVVSGTTVVAPGRIGLVHAPRSQILRAFAVGER